MLQNQLEVLFSNVNSLNTIIEYFVLPQRLI